MEIIDFLLNFFFKFFKLRFICFVELILVIVSWYFFGFMIGIGRWFFIKNKLLGVRKLCLRSERGGLVLNGLLELGLSVICRFGLLVYGLLLFFCLFFDFLVMLLIFNFLSIL